MTPDDFARLDLGFFPTPIEPLDRVGRELGVRLRIKRDDYSGFGGGGNKVRKLEFLMADAVALGAGVLITTGGHQSNHARMVAAAACRFGMAAVLGLGRLTMVLVFRVAGFMASPAPASWAPPGRTVTCPGSAGRGSLCSRF